MRRRACWKRLPRKVKHSWCSWGATLRGYQVERPDHAPVSVELEVRYTEDLRLEDGGRARRIGCRFIGISPEIVLLVAEFFTDKKSAA
jgi:hypothetical protein